MAGVRATAEIDAVCAVQYTFSSDFAFCLGAKAVCAYHTQAELLLWQDTFIEVI